MKKKLTAVALVVCMLAIMLVGASLAYFTDKDEATNVFTVGNVDITLTEPNWTSTGSQDAPEVYPGERLDKDPTVENVGANPCFVRIKVTGLNCLANACAQNTPVNDTLITVEGVNQDWMLYEGYYYYTKVLPVDDDPKTEGVKEDQTPACFTGIRMPTALVNGNATDEFHVDVYAEAVQAQGAKPRWADVQTMTVAEIAAWFTTCGMN